MARIIPARAGFTPIPGPRMSASEDHPRSRGVYKRKIRATVDTSWIIPARAGFTLVPLGGVPPLADHPRSRGVYYPKGPSP